MSLQHKTLHSELPTSTIHPVNLNLISFFFCIQVANFQRDGVDYYFSQNGAPNYHPNMFGGPEVYPNAKEWTAPPEQVNATVDYYDLYDTDNYSQARTFWEKVLDNAAKDRLVNNLTGKIKLANETIRKRAVEIFSNVSSDLGNRLKSKLNLETTVHL